MTLATVFKRPTRALALPFLLIGAMATSSGCVQEEQSGTLTINYRFGAGAQTCEVSDAVQNVRITLDGQEFAEDPCDDSGSVTLPSVPAGNYASLVVEGVDAEGTTVRDNLDLPADDESVEVLGGKATTKDVTLTPTPALVRYQFVLLDDNGLPYAPAAMIPIQEFRTAAFRQGGNLQLLAQDFIVAMLASSQVDMADPNRDLVGTDLDFITVGVIGENGGVLSTLPFMFAPPGAGKLVLVKINCTGTACDGTVEVMGGEIDPTGGETDTGGATSG
jgi:hypothetical protein